MSGALIQQVMYQPAPRTAGGAATHKGDRTSAGGKMHEIKPLQLHIILRFQPLLAASSSDWEQKLMVLITTRELITIKKKPDSGGLRVSTSQSHVGRLPEYFAGVHVPRPTPFTVRLVRVEIYSIGTNSLSYTEYHKPTDQHKYKQR